eukprot:1138164-Pelagomonas_calceolata.AAC.6
MQHLKRGQSQNALQSSLMPALFCISSCSGFKELYNAPAYSKHCQAIGHIAQFNTDICKQEWDLILI